MPTVLILGAGASMDFGFPSADELTYEICRTSAPSPKAAVRYHSTEAQIDEHNFAIPHRFDWAIVKEFKKALAVSQLSVDAFLENRASGKFYEIGKAAIAKVLLACENEERLFMGRPPHLHFEDMRLDNWKIYRLDSWYKLLWQRLVDPGEQNDQRDLFERFSDNKVSVITFNYDRSLEHFLFTALKANTGRDDHECAEKLKTIEIVHVYGSLGPLPWQGPPRIPYSSSFAGNPAVVGDAASKIDLVRRDNATENPQLARAHKLLRQAERLYFLGFGFDRTNLERLQLGHDVRAFNSSDTKATSKGLSLASKQRIGTIKDRNGHTTFHHLLDMTIYDLLYDHCVLV
jgi:hypothetical protein